MKKRSEFSTKAIKVVLGIRKGETLSYKEVARRAGQPKAHRAVGNILNRYYKECIRAGKKTIPCHRVIRSDGTLGGSARGEEEKRRLLQKEKAG